MAENKRVGAKREVICFSFPPELAFHIRKHENMSAYVRNLVIKDIEGIEQEHLIEQIKELLANQTDDKPINVDLDTLSAINSLIDK